MRFPSTEIIKNQTIGLNGKIRFSESRKIQKDGLVFVTFQWTDHRFSVIRDNNFCSKDR